MSHVYRYGLLLIALLSTPAVAQELDIERYRLYDENGYLFETPQTDGDDFDDLTMYLGAAFTQQFQAIEQSNENPEVELVDIGAGFNLATANLYLGAQLAEGLRVNLTTYLSSRHHPEAWVKGGYLLIDEMPFLGIDGVDAVMDYVTIRAGHFEINYGDAHFRRTDNGNAILNPFVGNYIMDSFTTEIGGEVYVRSGGLLGMVGVTNGEIRGTVVDPGSRRPSFFGKIGYDTGDQAGAPRFRLTGSAYTTTRSNNNTLYSGDRAGARFYSIFDVVGGATGFTNPRLSPGFTNEVTAFQVNPFIQVGAGPGLVELFGVLETATGASASETETRTVRQLAVEALYRIADFYFGGRYNVVSGEFAPGLEDVGATRFEVGGGWRLTPNVLLKAEYVSQTYNDYPPGSLYYGGKFSGLAIEGVVAF